MAKAEKTQVGGGFPGGIRAYPAREIAAQLGSMADAGGALARQIRGLDALRKAASQLVARTSLPEVLEELLELLFAAVQAERGAILMVESGELVTKAWRNGRDRSAPGVSRSIAGRVLRERAALLLDNALDDPRFSAARSVVSGGVRSAICVPLWVPSGDREDAVGVVYLDTSRFVHAFDEDDLALVTAIANLAAAKIHNVRLLEDSLAKHRLEEEMRLAARLQAGLLPAEPPALPGWSLAAWTRPCYAVGGDYYDWLATGASVPLALGDVAGKGASAALLMTVLRAFVRTCWDKPDLAASAAWLNRALLDSAPSGRYATLFLGRLERARGGLSFVNAGHPPPLLVRADGRAHRLQAGGIPLGLLPDARYEAGFTRIDPGDAVLAFSDGLPEALHADSDELGLERLLAIARAMRGQDAAAIAERVRGEIDASSCTREAGDDRTLLILTRDAQGFETAKG